MKTKDQKIAEFTAEPIKIGDVIIVDKQLYDVINVDSEFVYYNKFRFGIQKINIEYVVKSTFMIGENPFKTRDVLHQTTTSIDSLIFTCGYEVFDGTEQFKELHGVKFKRVNFNPIVVGENGEEIEFQRGLVWTLEQKQLLIESIYNNIEIGKISFRKRPFDYVSNRILAGKTENAGYLDLIDGKQRISALLEFVQNKFQDLHGNFFKDLSDQAQNWFGDHNITYVELPENTSDEKVIEQFLAVNFTGVPMSKDHIEYVQKIKMKK